MQIPWLFPDFSQYSFFPWSSTKFPDFSLTFAKSGISLTFPWPLDTLSMKLKQNMKFCIQQNAENVIYISYHFQD